MCGTPGRQRFQHDDDVGHFVLLDLFHVRASNFDARACPADSLL
jgi:hypothetical protein